MLIRHLPRLLFLALLLAAPSTLHAQLSITHTKISGVPATPDPNDIDGADWNAAHAITGISTPATGGTGADLSSTGGANQIVRQNSLGGAFTVSILAAADIPSLDTAKITTGTFADARIAASSVTQHQASLAIAASQITSGSIADARIPDLNLLSSGLTGSRCVETDGGGNLIAASGLCSTPLGPHDLISASHTASGLSAGDFLRATSATAFAFGPAALADLSDVTAARGNSTTVQLASGSAPSTGDCAEFDVNGNLVSAGAACGTGGTWGTITGTLSSQTDLQSALDLKAALISPSFTTPNLGTPSAGILTNATGLPVSTGISGLGAGVGTFLAAPTLANLAAAVPDLSEHGWLPFTIGFADLDTAGPVHDETLFVCAQLCKIEAVVVKHSNNFEGGTISAMTVSVGTAAAGDFYASAFDIFDTPGDTNFQDTNLFRSATMAAAGHNVIARFIAEGDDADQATAGSVDIWVKVTVLP